MRRGGLAPVLLLLLSWGATASAGEAEVIELIRSAATEIALVQKSQGNDGAIIAIADCYEKASTPNASVEDAQKCATQDWLISQLAIAYFTRLGPEGKENYSYKVAVGYQDRIATLLLHDKGVYDDQMHEFVRLLNLHALPAFAKAKYGCEDPPCQ
jgi:hypothetical protein